MNEKLNLKLSDKGNELLEMYKSMVESGYSNDFDPITLRMRARIVDASVPEPGSLILILFGLMVLFWHTNLRHRTFSRHTGN